MCDFLLLCGSIVCRCYRSLLASGTEVQSTCTVGSQHLVPCSRFPACEVPLYCFCLCYWNQGVHVLDSVPFSSTRNLDQECNLRPDTPPAARHGESWNDARRSGRGKPLVVGTFFVAKGMSVTLLQRTTSTDFWIFQLVGTVCVTKATFVTLSLKRISQRQDNHRLPLPQQLAQRTPQRLEGQGTRVPERRCNRHEVILRTIRWALSSDGLECAMTPLGAI